MSASDEKWLMMGCQTWNDFLFSFFSTIISLWYSSLYLLILYIKFCFHKKAWAHTFRRRRFIQFCQKCHFQFLSQIVGFFCIFNSFLRLIFWFHGSDWTSPKTDEIIAMTLPVLFGRLLISQFNCSYLTGPQIQFHHTCTRETVLFYLLFDRPITLLINVPPITPTTKSVPPDCPDRPKIVTLSAILSLLNSFYPPPPTVLIIKVHTHTYDDSLNIISINWALLYTRFFFHSKTTKVLSRFFIVFIQISSSLRGF
jgi:hypothetical protein